MLAEKGVQVTTTRFVVGRETYPIHEITSVAPYTVKPKIAGGAALAIFALLASPAAIHTGSTSFELACVVVLVLSIAYAATRRTTHVIAVATAGFSTPALVSTDMLFSKRVLATLKHSISMR